MLRLASVAAVRALARQPAAAAAAPVSVRGLAKKKDSKKEEEEAGPAVNIDADVLRPLSSKTKMSLDVLQNELVQLRIGIASPSLLDSVTVALNESRLPLSRVAQVVVKDPQTLMVNLFDPSQAQAVASSIQAAGLNLNPVADKGAIRVPVPRPTAEHRDAMVKMVERHAEKSRVAIRNLRQAALKDLGKHKSLPKDEIKRTEKAIQKIIDDRIKEVDAAAAAKAKEIAR